jgi:hypothetical protein
MASEFPMTAGRAALVVLVHRCLGGLMDPLVTLLEPIPLLPMRDPAGVASSTPPTTWSLANPIEKGAIDIPPGSINGVILVMRRP